MSNLSVPPKEGEFWAAFTRSMRLDVVQSLLSGNDTGCFTTEQYAREYSKQNHRHKEPWINERLLAMLPSRTHLLGLSDVVKEVAPDVWAAMEGTRCNEP